MNNITIELSYCVLCGNHAPMHTHRKVRRLNPIARLMRPIVAMIDTLISTPNTHNKEKNTMHINSTIIPALMLTLPYETLVHGGMLLMAGSLIAYAYTCCTPEEEPTMVTIRSGGFRCLSCNSDGVGFGQAYCQRACTWCRNTYSCGELGSTHAFCSTYCEREDLIAIQQHDDHIEAMDRAWQKEKGMDQVRACRECGSTVWLKDFNAEADRCRICTMAAHANPTAEELAEGLILYTLAQPDRNFAAAKMDEAVANVKCDCGMSVCYCNPLDELVATGKVKWVDLGGVDGTIYYQAYMMASPLTQAAMDMYGGGYAVMTEDGEILEVHSY